jgi:hypothetical protein
MQLQQFAGKSIDDRGCEIGIKPVGDFDEPLTRWNRRLGICIFVHAKGVHKRETAMMRRQRVEERGDYEKEEEWKRKRGREMEYEEGRASSTWSRKRRRMLRIRESIFLNRRA